MRRFGIPMGREKADVQHCAHSVECMNSRTHLRPRLGHSRVLAHQREALPQLLSILFCVERERRIRAGARLKSNH